MGSEYGEMTIEQLAQRARAGDREALDDLVVRIRDDVYGLALRMLWHPDDAEDASQEILVKVVTRLDSFRGEAAFRTWVYRVAANHLLSTRRRRMEQPAWTFPAFAADLVDGLDPAADAELDQGVLAEEVKLSCTLGMLQCLDRNHRLAYILGEVFELPSDQAATVSDVAADTYRKRLSRARTRIREFMSANCGLVSHKAECRCHRRVSTAVRKGRIDPDQPMFAGHPGRAIQTGRTETKEMEDLHTAAAVFRSHPDYQAPARVTVAIRSLLRTGRLRLMDDPEQRVETQSGASAPSRETNP